MLEKNEMSITNMTMTMTMMRMIRNKVVFIARNASNRELRQDGNRQGIGHPLLVTSFFFIPFLLLLPIFICIFIRCHG